MHVKVWTVLSSLLFFSSYTVGKQLDGSQGNCLESRRRLCTICWQNCQWVNDHGELAERRSFSNHLRFHFYWQVLVSRSTKTVRKATQNFLLIGQTWNNFSCSEVLVGISPKFHFFFFAESFHFLNEFQVATSVILKQSPALWPTVRRVKQKLTSLMGLLIV